MRDTWSVVGILDAASGYWLWLLGVHCGAPPYSGLAAVMATAASAYRPPLFFRLGGLRPPLLCVSDVAMALCSVSFWLLLPAALPSPSGLSSDSVEAADLVGPRAVGDIVGVLLG